MTMADLSGLGAFASQTAGVGAGLQQQALAQQMSQFMQALQFQQQQAALQQALNYGTQFGYAPGGNWMTWGQGGAQQPLAGTPTLTDQQVMAALGQSSLANAMNVAGVTGQFAQPVPSQYSAGTVLTSGNGAYGIVNQDGSVQMVSSEALQQTAQQRGTTLQALTQNAQPVDFQTLQRLSQGPPTGPTQQTLAAQQQAYQQALQAGALTGQFANPAVSADAYLQQGKAMNGQSFNDLPPEQQQFWLQYNQNNPTAAAQQWARGVNAALQQSGYQNPQAQPQQTLASQLQNAQLTGMYQGAPTEQASEFSRNLAQQMQQFQQTFGLQQGALTGQYNGAPTEAASEYARTLALQQGQLGQQYLATASQLQGPQNTFQLSNYLRGAQGNPNVPTYLNALQNNMGLPSFNAPGSTAPTPNSAQGLMSQMGGYKDPNAPQTDTMGGWYMQGAAQGGSPSGGAQPAQPAQTGGYTPGWDYNQTLNSIRGIAQTGAQALGPGSLERLSSDELGAFGSGLGAAGYSMPSFLDQYRASRVGQQAGMAPTSFA